VGTTESTPLATGGTGWDNFVAKGGFGLDQADAEPPNPFGPEPVPPVINAAPAEPSPIEAAKPELPSNPPSDPPVWRPDDLPADPWPNINSTFIPSPPSEPYQNPFTGDLPTPGPMMTGNMQYPEED
jgi:hypothetical protein